MTMKKKEKKSIKNFLIFQKQSPEKKETGGKETKEIKEKKNEIGVTISFNLTVYFVKRYIYYQRKNIALKSLFY